MKSSSLNVTVLAGGPGGEREVSLTSGRAVAAALIEAGHHVHLADITPGDLTALDRPADVIFPVLHGEWGESGELQDILEHRGATFVGSGSAASRLGMDKWQTKQLWLDANLPCPAGELITRPTCQTAPGPCVVKSTTGGSSLDCFVRRGFPETPVDIEGPVSYLLAKCGSALVEQLVDGYEMTVGILDDAALPPIWIDSSEVAAGWFDYKAKYSDNGSRHRFDRPPVLTEAGSREIQAMAMKAHRLVGCRDLSRVDFMIDRAGQPWILEINTMPGFTGRSLLPDAARQTGLGFPALCDRLVRMASSRRSSLAA